MLPELGYDGLCGKSDHSRKSAEMTLKGGLDTTCCQAKRHSGARQWWDETGHGQHVPSRYESSIPTETETPKSAVCTEHSGKNQQTNGNWDEMLVVFRFAPRETMVIAWRSYKNAIVRCRAHQPIEAKLTPKTEMERKSGEVKSQFVFL